MIHHLIEVVARLAGGELHGCTGLAGAGGGAVGQGGGVGCGVLDLHRVGLGTAILGSNGESIAAVGADAAHDIAGGPFAGDASRIVIAFCLCQRHTGVVDLHKDIRRSADLVDQGLVRIGGQRDCPRRTVELALGDHGLIGVQQLDGGDVLLTALCLGDGHGVVRLGGIIVPNAALLRADGEGDRRIQRHTAILAIFRPDTTVSGDNIRVLGNGELQHCRGQRVRVGIGRDRDGVAGARVFDRGAGDGQLHIFQHACGAGLCGIDFKDRLCGDVLFGGGHGEGGFVGVLRVFRYLNQRVGAIHLDFPAGQRVARAGGGGQGDGLALVDNRLGLCGGTVAHGNGGAAHGSIRCSGNAGKSTLTEVSRDGHFLAACFELHFCCITERPLRAAGVD